MKSPRRPAGPHPRWNPLRPTRVLVPTDFSEPAMKAAHYAVRLAEQLGASLTLLHVFEVPVYAQNLPGYPGFYLPGEDIQRIYDEAQSQARARLNVLYEELQPTELVVEHVLRIGTAHTHIIEAATDTRADLIVLATHGYTGLKHLFLGHRRRRAGGAPRPLPRAGDAMTPMFTRCQSWVAMAENNPIIATYTSHTVAEAAIKELQHFGSALFLIPGIGSLIVAGPLVVGIVGALGSAAVVGGLSILGAGRIGLGIPQDSVLQ